MFGGLWRISGNLWAEGVYTGDPIASKSECAGAGGYLLRLLELVLEGALPLVGILG